MPPRAQSNRETSLAIELGSLATFMERVAETPDIDPAQLLEIASADPNLELAERIGSGGRGVVYLARDLKLDRQVAVKVHRLSGHEDANRELLGEAKAMARLAHPNIVTVFDVRSVGGHLVLLMEYVPGLTLRAWLDETPRSAAAIIETFFAAGEGLAAAHDAELIHRDFKPTNVIVGSTGRVRVADFGLAASDDAESNRAGTPAYMAPEQAAGEPLDARADQYSFCFSLLEALADAPVKRRVRDALARGTSLEPSDRFDSMRDLLAELKPQVSKRKIVALTALTALTAVAIGALVFATRRDAAAPQCSGAEAEWRALWSADVAAALERGLVSTKRPHAMIYAARISESLDRYGENWRDARFRSCQDRQARRELCLDRALVRLRVGLAKLSRADATTADRALDLVDPRRESLCENEANWPRASTNRTAFLSVAATIDALAADRVVGNLNGASEAVAAVTRQVAELGEPVLTAELAWNQELVGGEAGGLEDADRERLSQLAILELAAMSASDSELRDLIEELQRASAPPRLLEAALSRLAAQTTAPAESAALLTRALEARRSQLGETNPLLFPLFSRLSRALVDSGQEPVARPYLADALVLVETFELGEPVLIETLRRLADVELSLNNTQAAIADYERLLTLRDSDHDDYPFLTLGLGLALVNDGQLERAEAVCGEAARLFEGPEKLSVQTVAAFDCIGRATIKQGYGKKALESFRAAASAAEAIYDDPHRIIEHQFGVFNALLDADREAEALDLFRKWMPLATERQKTQMHRAILRGGVRGRL